MMKPGPHATIVDVLTLLDEAEKLHSLVLQLRLDDQHPEIREAINAYLHTRNEARAQGTVRL